MKAWKTKRLLKITTFFKEKFLLQINAASIDKSVIEIEQSKAMSLLNCEWSDVGSWDTISELENFKNFHSHKNIEIESQNNFILLKEKCYFFELKIYY